MKEGKAIFGRIIESINAMSQGRKIALFLSGALIISGFLVILLWSSKEEYQILFSNLSPDDASLIVERLKEQKIPYEITGGGTVLKVPSRFLYETRLDMASQGLPKGGTIGFEIFDQSKIGTTEFVQRINYRRALQGELARTISQLKEVEAARVHLVVPKQSIFTSEQERARASVMVKLKSGSRLSKRQVQGIVHLVASSVESLDPSDVTVVDQRGEILSGGSSGNDISSIANSQLEYRQGVERDLEKRIESMLEKVLGPGKAIARVSAIIDFRQVEKKEEQFDPENVAIRSEQRIEETYIGAGGKAEGVPGAMSNLSGAGKAQGGKNQSDTAMKKNETINYELNRITSRIVEPTGSITRLSVAVLIDGSYEKKEGSEAPVYKPRTQEEMKKYEEIVKKAIGFNQERGDQVEVQNIPFEKVESVEEGGMASSGFDLNIYLPFVRHAVTGLLIILFLLFIVRPFVKGLRGSYLPHHGPAQLEPPSSRLAELQCDKETKALDSPIDKEKLIVDMAQKDPDQIAGIIRKWLNSP
jgi:flagellar M-ring protein FliF